jgi:multidrug efflux system membrane fusion protein
MPSFFNKYTTILSTLFLIVLVYLFGFHDNTENQKKNTNRIQTVKTTLVRQEAFPIIYRTSGYVTPITSVEVRPQTQSIVQTIHVKEGQTVNKGQLLFTLDERNDIANVEKAKAQLAKSQADRNDAKSTLQRNQELFSKNFISSATLESARNKLESLEGIVNSDKATLAMARTTLDNNKIKASIDGRLGSIHVRPGSLAQPNATPLTTILQLDPIQISFSIPSKTLNTLQASKTNLPVLARLAQNTFTGKLVFIDNTVDTTTGSIKVKAQFSNSKNLLWPGALVDIDFVTQTLDKALLVPTQAIITGSTSSFVYVVKDNESVEAQKVEILAIGNNQAAIVGLSANQRIVVEGTQNLRSGSKIKESTKASSAHAHSTKSLSSTP